MAPATREKIVRPARGIAVSAHPFVAMVRVMAPKTAPRAPRTVVRAHPRVAMDPATAPRIAHRARVTVEFAERRVPMRPATVSKTVSVVRPTAVPAFVAMVPARPVRIAPAAPPTAARVRPVAMAPVMLPKTAPAVPPIVVPALAVAMGPVTRARIALRATRIAGRARAVGTAPATPLRAAAVVPPTAVRVLPVATSRPVPTIFPPAPLMRTTAATGALAPAPSSFPWIAAIRPARATAFPRRQTPSARIPPVEATTACSTPTALRTD